MSLFQTLYSKKKDKSFENFLTEIVTHLFQSDHDLLFSWIRQLGNNQEFEPKLYTLVDVTSQAVRAGKRPDILVILNKSNEQDVLILESKIVSCEKKDQLNCYARLLESEFPAPGKKILIFITQYYEPKKREEVLMGTSSVDFYQTRWHDFYHFLKKRATDQITRETMKFMEEYGMTHANQFTIEDHAAISDLVNLFSLMDVSLADDVLAKTEKIAGEKIKPKFDRGYSYFMLVTKENDDNIRWLVVCQTCFDG